MHEGQNVSVAQRIGIGIRHVTCGRCNSQSNLMMQLCERAQPKLRRTHRMQLAKHLEWCIVRGERRRIQRKACPAC